MSSYPSMLSLILVSILGSVLLVPVAEAQGSIEPNSNGDVRQYKPRFDENLYKLHKTIWIGESIVEQGGPMSVNITCIVQADPVAKITWNNYSGVPVQTQPSDPSATVRTVVTDAENMSVLTLQYRDIRALRNPKQYAVKARYTCTAENSLGSDINIFEIKVGHLPDSPKLTHAEYRDESIVLLLNQSHVEPPVDIYRLEIADEQAHLFNKTSNNTYAIKVNLPPGEHKLNFFSHNPVGWSEEPYGSYFLSVVPENLVPNSGTVTIFSSSQTFITTFALLAVSRFLMTKGRISFSIC